LLADLKYAFRSIRLNPGFALLVVLLLALGIGANTAMFSIVDAWLLQPLPFPAADCLAIVLKSEAKTPTEPKVFPSFRDIEEWARRNHSFTSLSGFFWRNFEVENGGEGVFGMIVTANLLDTLGVHTQFGRTFQPADLDGPPVAVISHEYWRNRLGGAPNVLGSTIALSSKKYQVIGVLPPGFALRMINQGINPQILALIQKDEPAYASGGQGPIAAIGRLKPGASVETARSDLAAIQSDLDKLHRDNPQGYTVLVTNLQKDNTRNVRASLWIAAGAIGLLLLIVCANVGSLLLGRTLQRQREMAIRAALGSGRARIVRQLLTESIVIAAISTAAGVLLAYGGVRLFQAANPFGRMPVHAIAIDFRAVLFTIAASVGSILLFGLAPALHASRADINEVLKSAGRGLTGSRATLRSRAFLVSGQLALSLMLVVGAVLLLQTLMRLEAFPLGFRPDGVTVATVEIPKNRWNDFAARRVIYDRLIENLRAAPGIQSVAIENSIPLGGSAGDHFEIEGHPEQREELKPSAGSFTVTPGYFETMSIPVLAGRTLRDSDDNLASKVVVVNQSAAKRWFNGSAVGAHIKFPKDTEWLTVVGVVGDTAYSFYNTVEWLTGPQVFIPSKQDAGAHLSPVASHIYALIRGPAITAERMRALLQTTDPVLHLDTVQSLDDMVADAVRQPRLRTQSLGVFAGFALLLAAIGIYGVVAQSVIQRRHEIGVRMALGARSGDIARMVLGQGLRLAAGGIVVGVAGALLSTRILAAVLYGVKPTDPLTFTTAAAILLAAVILAALLPARSAAQVDPMSALRDE